MSEKREEYNYLSLSSSKAVCLNNTAGVIMMSSVTVRNAYKSYGSGKSRQTVLNGLNLTVESSSIYALIGASGCGKTTILSGNKKSTLINK